MRWQGRRQSSNVEDRRSQRAGGRKTTGILGLIVLLVGAYYGVDLSGIVGTPQLGGAQVRQSALDSKQEAQLNELARVVLADTESVWQQYFAAQGAAYRPATLVLYSGATQTSCGTGQAAMGPFYCPADRRVYLDLSFYEDMRTKLGAAGEAAFGYVIAHEVGHHVQNLTGVLPKIHQAQQQARSPAEANALSVRLELQADCYAGLWAKYGREYQLLGNHDVENILAAAASVGDDRLQHRSGARAVPENFTHGSSEQRMAWFRRGLQSTDLNQCNTFKG
ncbi:neutral zinc metallopeptidase [Neisseria leonii]|uniref:Neutral zinc metallopeptidase n=1 Tax=Neisseria leonii TaxID=2995413 RepID=A0A9X4IE59_9NEIS|nr:neutral zinc metallopeptidase [Neisseria sp. 51.81]MDD9328406.1 neutral zinc metallopeptidase [Neisseria sp. 51.81]